MKYTKFIFIGRLEYEKGFDLVIKAIERFSNAYFYIFGTGTLENSLKEINKDNYKFFGWKEKDFIKKYLKDSNYCLMPSRFLETFGLSGLESISHGVPLIGFSKGGLQQFILEENDIDRQGGQDELDNFNSLLNEKIYYFTEEKFKNESKISFEISKKYSLENWLDEFKSIFGEKKKILIVNDYISKIGGIEEYIYDIKDILQKQGYSIEIVGFNLPNNKLGNFLRKLFLPITAFNIFGFFKIRKNLNDFNPDIIWFHSVTRLFGWMGLFAVKKKNTKNYIMYHDLGYFHPYPSKVYDEGQIFEFNLKNFIKSSNTKNPFKLIAVFFKYLSNSCIKKGVSKYINLNIVPSDFMIDILDKSWKQKSKVLHHFKK